MSAEVSVFGRTREGAEVSAVVLAAGGVRVRILTLGAALNDLRLAGVDWPLTLGGSAVVAYEGPMRYFGSIVGPVANRIAGAAAEIGGRRFRFDANDGVNCLHGGRDGVDTRNWRIDQVSGARLVLALELADGEGGFPGNRRIEADFAVAAPAELVLTIKTTSDAPTLANFANHSYWNLDGAATLEGHVLRIDAERFLPLGPDLIPLGGTAPIGGTAYDFRAGRRLEPPARLDGNLCLSDRSRKLCEVAELVGRRGVRLQLATTEPGLQIYDAARIGTAPNAGHGGAPYGAFSGLALEAQLWPDASNHAEYPPILLGAGETRTQITRWRFDRVTST